MSLNRIFERFNRIARSYAPEYHVGESDSLREAERLIAEEKRRDEAVKKAAEAARDEELNRLKREIRERDRAAAAGKGPRTESRGPASQEGKKEDPKAAPGHGGERHGQREERREAKNEGAQAGTGAHGNDGTGQAGRPDPASGWAIDRARRILGVSAEAGHEEITRAYRSGMLLHHPDRNINRSAAEQDEAKRRAQELNAAYALLRLVAPKA